VRGQLRELRCHYGSEHPTSVTTLRRLAEAFGTHLVVGFEDQPEKASELQLVAVS
jgi:hypothetical protein